MWNALQQNHLQLYLHLHVFREKRANAAWHLGSALNLRSMTKSNLREVEKWNDEFRLNPAKLKKLPSDPVIQEFRLVRLRNRLSESCIMWWDSCTFFALTESFKKSCPGFFQLSRFLKFRNRELWFLMPVVKWGFGIRKKIPFSISFTIPLIPITVPIPPKYPHGTGNMILSNRNRATSSHVRLGIS